MTDFDNAIAKSNGLYTELQKAETPEETKKIEGVSAAGRAWAWEHKQYDAYVEFARLYILARRKTTELIRPLIKQGRPKGDEDVTILYDIGLSKKQWNRRCKELDLSIEQIEEYFHECFANGWWPSINGLFHFKQEPPDVEPCVCPACGREHTKMA